MMPSASVLLVEDDSLLRECLAEMLGDAGWQVAVARDAAEALGQLDQGGMPGVLVTDLVLGRGRDGLALIAEARRRWPQVRAVLTSGADAARLDMHPADRFLGKPFTMDALIQAVTELAREAIAESSCTGRRP